MISSLAYVLNLLLTFFVYLLIAQAIMSWLLAFNVVNYSNQFVRSIWQAVNALTEPLLGPIRARLPNGFRAMPDRRSGAPPIRLWMTGRACSPRLMGRRWPSGIARWWTG